MAWGSDLIGIFQRDGLLAALPPFVIARFSFQHWKSRLPSAATSSRCVVAGQGCAHSGEFNPVLAAQVQLGGVILHGVVTAETGEFNCEDDVYFSGDDVGFEAAALFQVGSFAPCC